MSDLSPEAIVALAADIPHVGCGNDEALALIAALTETRAFVEEWGGMVVADCAEGHRVAVDDGDGGVYRCPLCALTEARRIMVVDFDRAREATDRATQFEEWWRTQRGRATAAEARLAAVRALHAPCGRPDDLHCSQHEPGDGYPCATVRAIEEEA